MSGKRRNKDYQPDSRNKSNSHSSSKSNRRKRNKEVEVNVSANRINRADLSNDRDVNYKSAPNDVAWYANNPSLLRDAASFPYSNMLGTKMPWYKKSLGVSPSVYSVPGVLSIRYIPTIGVSQDNYSPINIAARSIYSFVRHANAGSSNYDSPDLMMYLLAMDSAYSMYAWMMRIYGIARTYSQYNRYYPNALLAAIGIEPNSVYNNLAQVRYFINEYAYKLGAFAVPSDMSYFLRHIWMNSGIYLDSPTNKAQSYVYTPAYLYKFDELNGAGRLLPVNVAAYQRNSDDHKTIEGKLKWWEVVEVANSIMQPIISSEDMNIMSGDILKAYGSDRIFKVATIAEDYQVVPEFNLEVLSQIQNSRCFGSVDNDSLKITQNTDASVNLGGAILQNISISPTAKAATIALYDATVKYQTLVTMYKDDVTPADTMVATRMMTLFNTYSASPSATIGDLTYGSEFTLDYNIFFMNGTPSDNSWYLDGRISMYTTPDGGSTINDCTKYACLLSNFNYHPMFIPWDEGAKIIHTPMIDQNNFTSIDHGPLSRMHETALLSEFSSPQMAGLSANPYKG